MPVPETRRLRKTDSFRLEKNRLELNTSREAREAARTADDAVTRDPDGDRIAPDSSTDGTRRPRSPDPSGHLGIGPDLPEGNVEQGSPHLSIEGGALRLPIERSREPLEGAREEPLDVLGGPDKRGGQRWLGRLRRRVALSSCPQQVEPHGLHAPFGAPHSNPKQGLPGRSK